MRSKTFSIRQLQASSIALIDVPDEIDTSGYDRVRAGIGKAVVEMLPEREKTGLILLPDDVKTKTRPDVGVVVSAGYGVPLKTGDVVVVRYGHGKRVKGFYCDGFKANETMVFCGRAGGDMVDDPFYGDPLFYARDVRWDDSIVVKIEDGKLIPLGRNLIIRLKPVKMDGTIHLSETRHECDAEIVAIGPDAFYRKTGQGKVKVMDVSVGETVVFDDGSVQRSPALTFLGDDLATLPDSAALAVH